MPEYSEDKLCVCGCPASEHHQSWFIGGGHSYEECERYGWNEFGGMMPDGFRVDSEGRVFVRWIDHCQRFTPVAIPMPSAKSLETIIWQHRAQGLSGDYRVDPNEHAKDAERCPLCKLAKHVFTRDWTIAEFDTWTRNMLQRSYNDLMWSHAGS